MTVIKVGDGSHIAAGPDSYNEASSATEPVYRGRVKGDAYDRVQITGAGVATGDGTAAPTVGTFPSLLGDLQTWRLDSYSGASDDAKMALALADWAASTAGGTILLSARAYTFTTQWVSAYTAGLAKLLRIVGPGFSHYGGMGVPASPCTVDHQYNGAGAAKISAQHIGTFEMTGFVLKDTTGSSKPFVLCTNATPDIHHMGAMGSKTGTACDQDFLVMGAATGTTGGGESQAFQGYGGGVEHCYFYGIRRIAYGKGDVNSIYIEKNLVSTTCGSNLAGGACIEFDGTGSGGSDVGNFVQRNTIELTNYVYAVKCTASINNILGPNGIYDPGGGSLACYRFETTASGNFVTDGYRPDTMALISEHATVANTTTVLTSHGNQHSIFAQPVDFISSPTVIANGQGVKVQDAGGKVGHLDMFTDHMTPLIDGDYGPNFYKFGMIGGNGSANPTVAPNANAGTGATATIAGKALDCTVTLTTGTGPSAGAQFRITWPTAVPGTARCFLEADDLATATLMAAGHWTVVVNASNQDIALVGTPAASTTYKFKVLMVL